LLRLWQTAQLFFLPPAYLKLYHLRGKIRIDKKFRILGRMLAKNIEILPISAQCSATKNEKVIG